jgi:hypothetical protein
MSGGAHHHRRRPGQAFARGQVQSAPFVVRVALDDTGLARTLPAGSAGEVLPAMSKPRTPSEEFCFGRSQYDLCQSVLETPAAGPLRVRGDHLAACSNMLRCTRVLQEMDAMGQERPIRRFRLMSALPPRATAIATCRPVAMGQCCHRYVDARSR